jgi:hypothetical protein
MKVAELCWPSIHGFDKAASDFLFSNVLEKDAALESRSLAVGMSTMHSRHVHFRLKQFQAIDYLVFTFRTTRTFYDVCRRFHISDRRKGLDRGYAQL